MTIPAGGRPLEHDPRQEYPVHIVTKILAVFGAILSVLLAALTISFAA
ncbi:MAG: hypothetical protein JNK35_09120, partial [Phycisphaerae bacterium]|nr:hypothetical protein [Phycisphaerae bacterium]